MSEDESVVPANRPSSSGVVKLGGAAFLLSVIGGLAISDRRNWELDASLAALVVIVLIYTPVFMGPALALGTIGAAFADGILKKSSLQGVLLAAAGVALEWVLWRAGR